MRSTKLPVGLTIVLFISLTLFGTATRAIAQQETLLYSFEPTYGSLDGAVLYNGLVFDAAGNLYGTTAFGGIQQFGTVFKLSPQVGGGWTETVLHYFDHDDVDGVFPTSGLVFDAAGNLYGMTGRGGKFGQGTVFELSPQIDGSWQETVLHAFDANGVDGSMPSGGVVLDAANNVYGTTEFGGNLPACNRGRDRGCGVVFELTRGTNGNWTENILHTFRGYDGEEGGGLTFDATGNLYGTTFWGGSHDQGIVFQIRRALGGTWTEKVLHNFSGLDGSVPNGGLLVDASGKLYGVSMEGGANLGGTVFEMAPKGGGNWSEMVLYSFVPYSDGFNPAAGLVRDAAGNFYGTTTNGGMVCSGGSTSTCGTVFELMPTGDANWTESILHKFGSGTDGQFPIGNLILDGGGHLFGTTAYGGTGVYGGLGTVFEVIP